MRSSNSYYTILVKFKGHIVFKIVTLILVLAFLTPAALKFAHIFNHHKHEICKGEYQTHLHTSDYDCSFHKFKLTKTFTIPEFSFDFFTPKHNHDITSAQYLFLSNTCTLHFKLRGPPNLI